MTTKRALADGAKTCDDKDCITCSELRESKSESKAKKGDSK